MRVPLLRIPFLLAAEVLASLGVWHGTPTDWQGEPPHFWSFEVLRLQYWVFFGLILAGIWIAEWMSSQRRFLARALAVLGAACVLATEVLTSIYFWKRLLPNEAEYLGWLDPRRYTWEHLSIWALVMLLGIGLWYLWSRWKRREVVIPTV